MKKFILIIIVQMGKMFCIYFSIIINILLIPVKFIFYIMQLMSKYNGKLLVIGDVPLGDLTYIIKYINQINEKVIVFLPLKYNEFIDTMLNNNNIEIINNINFKTIFSYKIKEIIAFPTSRNINYKLFSLLFVPWKISIVVTRIFSVSNTNTWEWLASLLKIPDVIYHSFVLSFKWNIFYYKFNEYTEDKLVREFFNKKFNIKITNIVPKCLSSKHKWILINLYGYTKERHFPIKLLDMWLKKQYLHNFEIKFIGVKKYEWIEVNNIMEKNKNLKITNHVGKTSINDLIYLVKNAKLVISAETSIVHISHVLHTPCLVWLNVNSPPFSNKIINMSLEMMKFWNWSDKSNIYYVNSINSVRNNILNSNNKLLVNEIDYFQNKAKEILLEKPTY